MGIGLALSVSLTSVTFNNFLLCSLRTLRLSCQAYPESFWIFEKRPGYACIFDISNINLLRGVSGP